jgi:hypothetical protein
VKIDLSEGLLSTEREEDVLAVDEAPEGSRQTE